MMRQLETVDKSFPAISLQHCIWMDAFASENELVC